MFWMTQICCCRWLQNSGPICGKELDAQGARTLVHAPGSSAQMHGSNVTMIRSVAKKAEAQRLLNGWYATPWLITERVTERRVPSNVASYQMWSNVASEKLDAQGWPTTPCIGRQSNHQLYQGWTRKEAAMYKTVVSLWILLTHINVVATHVKVSNICCVDCRVRRMAAVDLLNHVKCGAWGETEDAHGIAHDARAGKMPDHQQHQETEDETRRQSKESLKSKWNARTHEPTSIGWSSTRSRLERRNRNCSRHGRWRITIGGVDHDADDDNDDDVDHDADDDNDDDDQENE